VAKQSYYWISRLIVVVVSIALISAPLHAVTQAHAGGERAATTRDASAPPHEHKPSTPAGAPSCCHATCAKAATAGPAEVVIDVLSPFDIIPPTAVRIRPRRLYPA
jgi:hypothetical protein